MTLKPYSLHRHYTKCSLCNKGVFSIPLDGWFSENTKIHCVRTGDDMMFVFCAECWHDRREWITSQILDHPLHQNPDKAILDKMRKRYWEIK